MAPAGSSSERGPMLFCTASLEVIGIPSASKGSSSSRSSDEELLLPERFRWLRPPTLHAQDQPMVSVIRAELVRGHRPVVVSEARDVGGEEAP